MHAVASKRIPGDEIKEELAVRSEVWDRGELG